MTEAGLDRVAGDAAPVLDRVTRLGFATKGLLTVIVGVLALRHALGQGGRLTGQEGAIRTLRDQPFGTVALVVLTVGLSGYALWMFVSAFVDLQGKGTSVTAIAERLSFFVTGIGYAALAYGTLRLLLGDGGAGTGLDDLAARVLTPVVGRWLVGLAGATVITAGVLQIRLGLTAGFFGNDQEVQWFLENIEAGTIYTNRAAGATTGAWPGVQCFGGWKGSGSSGKGIGALYTLPLYMHEQSQTMIG